MKFNRILLIVVSLALMLLALAGCGKDAAQDSQKKLNVVRNISKAIVVLFVITLKESKS